MKTPLVTRRALILTFGLTIGCQPAAHYEKPAPEASAPPKPVLADAAGPAPDLTLAWISPPPTPARPPVPIEFIHETDGPEWSRLTQFWNPPSDGAGQAAAALALSPLTAAVLADARPVVKVRVPAGLDDPRPFLPGSNLPTLEKWDLGRRLFFDRDLLTDKGGLSCATCHDPKTGFADNNTSHYGVNTATLVNCVFNRRQFWDGRVASLEEVVQRTAADETAPDPEPPPFRHVWGGVVRRLRFSAEYEQLFRDAFGTRPTQDGVGKALATYLRTLLAADSVYDRALAAQDAEHAAQITAAHYEKALDDAALKKLGIEGKSKAEAAKQILLGHLLFHDPGEHQNGCIRCHNGRDFTDGQFHNLGVGWKVFDPDREEPLGRFASLPPGLKERAMVGAYKTPTLRGLSRTVPYFHDGSAATLEEAVAFHLKGGVADDYRDAVLAEPRELTPQEVSALVLFLRALDGETVDAAVSSPPPK